MRISDWSSDVCSSDLSDGQVGHVVVVHDIEMNPVGAGGDNILYFFPQAGKVSGQQAGSNTGGLGSRHGREFLWCEVDRKSTRLTPVTNAHLVCRLLLEKKNI